MENREEDVEMGENEEQSTITEEILEGLNKEFGKLSIKPKLEFTKTNNGALALKSSGSLVLDLFAKGGAMRKQENEVKELFLKAIADNPTLAMKCLFYLRDVRGGQGERNMFRICLRMLAMNPKLAEIAKRNIKHIAEYGRWDDVIHAFESTPLQKDAYEVVRIQLEKDKEAKAPSLLAKWLPSENASSKKTKRLACSVMEELDYPPKKYRKMLSGLRKKIGIVETKMSENKWKNIQFDKVPSQAFKKYNKAFRKHEESRFSKFLEDVKSGKKDVKVGTLYPYDIVNKVMYGRDEKEKETMDVLWSKLPDFMNPNENNIVVVDVSGSMTNGVGSVKPINVAISLGLYIGERCPLNGFITFASNPAFVRIEGKTLSEKVRNMSRANWGMSTDIQKVFDLVLSMQVKNRNAFGSNPINRIFIISDMQFNVACPKNNKTNYDAIKKKYEKAGLKKPSLVFWNVNAKGAGIAVDQNEADTFLVSGCSPTVLKTAMKSNPKEFMLEVLNGERYKNIF